MQFKMLNGKKYSFGMTCYEVISEYLSQFMAIQESNPFRYDRIIFTYSNVSPITH